MTKTAVDISVGFAGLRLKNPVFTASGAVKASLESTAMPLGLMASAQFPAAPAVTLEPGEILLLLTDGILETMGADGDYFGASVSIGVTVSGPAAVVTSITATPATVSPGGQTTISWTTWLRRGCTPARRWR